MADKIYFPGIKPQWIFDRDGVAFLALVNSKPIRCIVSMEALVQDYGARSGTEKDCLEAFNKNRVAIEKEAIARINAQSVTPDREVFIRASPERSNASRLMHVVPSPDIAKRPELAMLLRDVTLNYVGRFAPHSFETRVYWDFAGKPDDNLFQVKLEDLETESSTVDWFSLHQLKDPEYLRRRFDFLWAEYLSAAASDN